METFLLYWFAVTTAAFLVYIIYDFRRTARATSQAGGGGASAAGVASAAADSAAEARRRESEAALDAEKAAKHTLERLNHQTNHWDWQQAVANAIASLRISRAGSLGVLGLAYPRHSFPRHMVLGRNNSPHPLSGYDLHQAVEDYHHQTKHPEVEVWKAVDEQFGSFLNTRDSIREPRKIDGSISTPIELRPDLKEKIQDVRSKYPFFNGSHPLHEADLKLIFEKEQIEIHTIKNLPLLSLFVEYTNERNEKKKAVVIREDDVHQALKEFLLWHELGHWFLHFETGFARDYIGENYYLHSSTEWQPLELDADAFAMTALFPTPYLADRENSKGPLTKEDLFAEFTAGMDDVRQALKENMLRYIQTRIDRYHQFKEAILPVRIPVKSVREEDVEALLRLSEDTDTDHPSNWVWMDENFFITRASRGFLKLFDMPESEVIGKRPLDLVMEEEAEAIRERFRGRLERQEAIFYFTRLKDGRRVAVYSFPILRGKKDVEDKEHKPLYVGSIGYLILSDQVPSSAFHPTIIHTT